MNRVIRAGGPTAATATTRLSPLDALFGSGKVIDATFFFPERLDIDALAASLRALLRRYPCFGGRVGRSPWRARGGGLGRGAGSPFAGWHVAGDGGVPLCERHELALRWDEAAAVPDCGARFLHEALAAPAAARDVWAGRAAPMGVSVTHFRGGGGSALGVSMSHGLVDAHGFYATVREWARLHAALGGGSSSRLGGDDLGDPPPLITSRDCIDEALLRLYDDDAVDNANANANADDGAKAVDLSTWTGALLWAFVRRTAARGLGARRRRAVVRLSRDELAAMKAACSEGAFKATTNEALCSLVGGAATKLLGLGGDGPGVRWGAAANARGRVACVPDAFVGNAVHQLEAFGLPAPHAAGPTPAAFCKRLRCDVLDPDPAAPVDFAHAWAAFVRDLGRGRLRQPGADAAQRQQPHILSNFQARFPALDADFGAGPCARVVPGVGDTLHFAPGPGGGADVFLNLHGLVPGGGGGDDWIERCESDEFRRELFPS